MLGGLIAANPFGVVGRLGTIGMADIDMLLPAPYVSIVGADEQKTDR